jgi:hypothetical protein
MHLHMYFTSYPLRTRTTYPTPDDARPCKHPRPTDCWPDRDKCMRACRQTDIFVRLQRPAGRSVGFLGLLFLPGLFSSSLSLKCETCFWLAPELAV